MSEQSVKVTSWPASGLATIWLFFIMLALGSIADQLERIADALERESPPPIEAE